MAFEQTFTAARFPSTGTAAVDPATGRDNETPGPASGRSDPTTGHLWFHVAAIGGLLSAYTATIYVAHGHHLVQAILGGLANTLAVVVVGGAARWLIVHRLVGRSRWRQVAGHLCLGTAFSLLALWLLFIFLGMINDLSPVHFKVAPFTAGGNAWQFLENVTTYVVIALLSYMQTWQHVAAPIPEVISQPQQDAAHLQAVLPRPGKPARHFIRRGEDILPVDLDHIVCINGADDYAEVSTLDRTYLVKMTLNEFNRTLDPARFLRVHRSAIVNLEYVERAESAGGGRMLVHLGNGRTIKASRAGTQLLRSRIL